MTTKEAMRRALADAGASLRPEGRRPDGGFGYAIVLGVDVRRAVDARDPSRGAAHLLRAAVSGASKRVSWSRARLATVVPGKARRGADARFVVHLPDGSDRRAASAAVRHALAIELAAVAAGWTEMVLSPRERRAFRDSPPVPVRPSDRADATDGR